MLKPNRTEIDAQASNLESDLLKVEDQKDARALVRQLADYSQLEYPELDTKLAAISGYEAQQILAALARVEGLDQDMDKIQVQGVLTSEENNDRIGWAEFIRSVLYDGAERGESIAVGEISARPCGTYCGRCGGFTCRCSDVWGYL